MKTLEEVLEIMQSRVDRITVEHYIECEWLRPVAHDSNWYFEEIDIARLQLIHHLIQEIDVNENGMDIVLSLLDQLYGTRAQMKTMAHAINQQSSEVQVEIWSVLRSLKTIDGIVAYSLYS